MTSLFGNPGLPPEAVRVVVDKLLEFVPEEDREAALDQLLEQAEGLRGSQPAQAGEMILFGEAAVEELRRIVNAAREGAPPE